MVVERFLSRSGSPPYVSSPAVAMRGEPEAVDEDAQDEITRAAGDRELRTWQTTRDRMLGEIAHLRTHVHSPHVARSARALEREIQALDCKLCDK